MLSTFRGKLPLKLKEGELIPLSDGAGEIAAVGAEAHKWKKGDRVATLYNPPHQTGADPSDENLNYTTGSAVDGVLSQYIVLDQDHLVRIPDHLSYEEASTLPCAALTAYNALFGLKGHELRAGDAVLVEGTGGVSVFAAQFAAAAGAKVVVTSSSDKKLEFVKQHVDRPDLVHTVNYKTTPDWDKESLKLVGPVDHLLEVAGSSTIGNAISATKPGGVISAIGIVGDMATQSNGAGKPNDPSGSLLAQIILNRLVIRGLVVGSREMFEQMNKLIDANKLKPIVHQVFGWKEAQQAFEVLYKQQFIGKIVIRID